MANNSTEFSFMFKVSGKPRIWASALYERLLQVTGNLCDKENPVHPPQDDLTRLAVNMYAEMEDWVGFCLEEEAEGLWIHDDAGCCNLENVAMFIHEVLKWWNLPQLVAFSWADSCSKPRLDEFSGGAFAITQNSIKSYGAYQWMREQEQAFAKAQAPHADLNPLLTAVQTILPYFGNPESFCEMPWTFLDELKKQVEAAKQEQKESRYLHAGGTICPECQCSDIEGKSFDVNGNQLSQKVYCLNCETEWTDVYTLSGIENINQKQDANLQCKKSIQTLDNLVYTLDERRILFWPNTKPGQPHQYFQASKMNPEIACGNAYTIAIFNESSFESLAAVGRGKTLREAMEQAIASADDYQFEMLDDMQLQLIENQLQHIKSTCGTLENREVA